MYYFIFLLVISSLSIATFCSAMNRGYTPYKTTNEAYHNLNQFLANSERDREIHSWQMDIKCARMNNHTVIIPSHAPQSLQTEANLHNAKVVFLNRKM